MAQKRADAPTPSPVPVRSVASVLAHRIFTSLLTRESEERSIGSEPRFVAAMFRASERAYGSFLRAVVRVRG
jgi:hypothetical protein